MKLIKNILVAMLLGIMAIQMAWAYEDNVNWYLVNSANMGDLKAVKYYIHKGADVNARDNQGKSVFDRADKLDSNDEIFEFLLSSGAKCDDCDE